MPKIQQNFLMHENLLRSVIQRQAGSLAKAMLEGAMNSIEAGATRVDITLTDSQLIIKDDGKGFRSKAEIQRCFRTFGEPHTEEENKIWANFRMGRGQLFSFGVNTWKTGKYMMTVDINKALGYELEELAQPAAGCHIDVQLYSKLANYDIHDTKTQFKRDLLYAPCPIYLNGEQITKTATEEKDWSIVNEDAYLRLNNSNYLVVYNLGVRVCDIYTGRIGAGGTCVTKKQVKVNFARNDIQSDCKVWQAIRKVVDAWAAKEFEKKKEYTDAEIEKISSNLRANIPGPSAYLDAPILYATTGRKYSMRNLMHNVPYTYRHLSVIEHGSRAGDILHRKKLAFMLSKRTLDLFQVKTVDAFLQLWLTAYPSWNTTFIKMMEAITDAETLTASINDTFEILDTKKYSKTVQAWINTANTICRNIDLDDHRRIVCGSGPALGWTDGCSYIALQKEFLAGLPISPAGLIRLAAVVVHEMTHKNCSANTHDHDQAFYENFHDTIVSGNYARALNLGLTRMLVNFKAAKVAERKIAIAEDRLEGLIEKPATV